jgi:uncharacterized protein
MYRSGRGGVEKDYAEAMRWFRKAAERDNPYAQYLLGQLYQRGQGTGQDYREAMTWFRNAADRGYLDALLSVGWLYENGLGVPEDKANAIDWYRKAAKAGSGKARQALERLGKVQ